eukprot:g7756.t1
MAPTDRDILLALYNATGGPRWHDSTNWERKTDLSDWRLVRLNDNLRVEKLRLDENNLRGPIPSELWHLSALKELNLSDNQLSGE